MKKLTSVALVILLLFVFSACATKNDTYKIKVNGESVSAASLVRELRKSESAFNAKYKDASVYLSGTVKSVSSSSIPGSYFDIYLCTISFEECDYIFSFISFSSFSVPQKGQFFSAQGTLDDCSIEHDIPMFDIWISSYD